MRASACRAAIRLVRPHPPPHPRDGALEIGAFALGFARANALGGLERQRAGEQALMAAAQSVGAVAVLVAAVVTVVVIP